MKIKSTHFKKQYDLNKAELIGQGNFAQVYRIFDSDFNDSIAIRKVKKNQADMDDINKQKHINEELRKVDNENILKIYDIIDQQEIVWYITQYCSGGSLWDALNICKDNKMGQKQALECILQMSKGIQQLHNHRITHRDLKPQNVLLKSKYVAGKLLPLIKLADFGLSTQKIIMQTIAGTKQYIAPEQAKFHNYTNAVDVWSLGIIFDQVLHGTPFYCGEDNKEVFNKILKMPFKIRDQSIRNSIKQLLISLLKKKPYERPIIATIRSTLQKILQEIQNESIQKVNDSFSEKSKKSKSSNQIKQSGLQVSKNSSEAKLNSAANLSKNNIFKIQSSKVYQNISVEPEKFKKLQKTQRSNFAPNISPTGRSNPILVNDELHSTSKNYFVIPKIDLKLEARDRIISINTRQKTGKNTSIVDQIIELQKKQEIKIQKSIHQKTQTPVKQKPQTPVKVQPIPPINQKISIFRSDKKKVIVGSNLRKEELRKQIIDISTYKIRVFNSKKLLLQKQLKLEKMMAFLPNTQLSPNDFQQTRGSSDEMLSNLKKKANYLNYFTNSQDYEIKLMKGSNQLLHNKQICLEQLRNIQANLKRIFQEQIDNYIDQYIQKTLK